MLARQKEDRQRRFMQNRSIIPNNSSSNVQASPPVPDSLVSQPLQSEEVVAASVETPGNQPIAPGSIPPPATPDVNRENLDDDLPAYLRRQAPPAKPEEFVEINEVQEALLAYWREEAHKRKREEGELADLFDACKVGVVRPVLGHDIDTLTDRFASVGVDAPRPVSGGEPEDLTRRNAPAAAQPTANTGVTRVSFAGFRSQLFPLPAPVPATAQASVLAARDDEPRADEPEEQAAKKFRRPHDFRP